MGLAIGWDTPNEGPTVTMYLIVAVLSVLAAVTVVLSVRWYDKRQRERAAGPVLQAVASSAEQLQQQAAVMGEIRSYLVRDAGRPHLHVIKGG